MASPADGVSVCGGVDEDPRTGFSNDTVRYSAAVLTNHLVTPLVSRHGPANPVRRIVLARHSARSQSRGSPSGGDSRKPESSAIQPMARKPIYPVVRNAIERVVALGLLVILSPLLLALFMLIRVTSEGPGLFWSSRVGRAGQLFSMPKFRTMYSGTDLVPREAMPCLVSPVTPIGAWLRRWSLDELPQLWSIVAGDMAFIGPRPLIPQDDALAERVRLGLSPHIRPGLTGLAQINGRNHVLPRAKARYDVFYGRKISAGLDWMILRDTVSLVIRGTGVW